MGVIHFGEKFRTSLAKYFASKSYTEDAYNHNIDAEFSGSDIVHVTAVATTKLNRYDKTVDPSTGSRFGPVHEVTDHKYTYRMTQDDSLDLSVDRGNNDAQFNMKKAGAVMKAYTDKEIRPYTDKYRLRKWTEEAGIHVELAADPTEDNIIKSILELHNEMVNSGAPEDGATLYIDRAWLPTLALAKQWEGLETLGKDILPKGYKGRLDGMGVRPVPSRLLPSNVYFAIFHKDSIIAPGKINIFRAITDSENMLGDRLQYRKKHDAFVMPNLAEGTAVACKAGTVTDAPTITLSGSSATVAGQSGDVLYYTLDGSDPRYESAEAKVYSAPVTLADGQTIRACAKHDGKWNSAIAEQTYTAAT